MAFNTFINDDIRDCYFDYEQAVLLRFWSSRISAIRSIACQQFKLVLLLEENVTAPSKPKSDRRVTENKPDDAVGVNKIIMVTESKC